MELSMGVNLLYSTLLLLPVVCPAYAAALAEGGNANMVEENDSTPRSRWPELLHECSHSTPLDFSYTFMVAA
jgi:hypothetical protein